MPLHIPTDLQWSDLVGKIKAKADSSSVLPNTTKYGSSISLSINTQDYVVTAQLKDQDGNNLGAAQTIDLPLESVVVSGSYDSTTKEVVLTLQGGSTVRFSVADLVSGLQEEITPTNKLSADLIEDGTINKTVTAAEKAAWNAGIGSGKYKVLTTEDYDWPTANPDGVALWKLENGLYLKEADVRAYVNNTDQPLANDSVYAIFSNDTYSYIYSLLEGTMLSYVTRISDGGTGSPMLAFLTSDQIIDSLSSTSTIDPLSANQGKVLNDKIGGDLSNLDTADKTSLIAAINELVGSGGGSQYTVLTEEDYNWPTANPTGVAAWLLEPGLYVMGAENSTEIPMFFESAQATATPYLNGVSMFVQARPSVSGASSSYTVASLLNSHGLVETVMLIGDGSASSSEGFLIGSSRIMNNLTTSSGSGQVLDARQGPVIASMIGDLSTLTTTTKTSAVAAINEINATLPSTFTNNEWNALWA